jgi:hypothetical protein
VEFICQFFRFDTVGNEISAPFSQVEPIVSNAVVASLISGEDPDVTPNPWSYLVKIRVTGRDEFICFITMPMTDANFTALASVQAPATPEWYVLKSDFLNLEDALGNPVSHGDVDAAIAVHDADPAAHPAIVRVPDPSAAPDGKVITVISGDYALADPSGGLDEPAADLLYRRLDTTVPDADIASTIARDSEVTSAVANEATARDAAIAVETSRAEAAEDLLAPLASPTFTGNPAAPTPSPGDNDTSIATTAFTTAAVAAEASARTTAIGVETTARIAEETRALAAEALLAPLASPALTGNPTAPSPTAGDNDTSIATTQFVTGAIATAISALINGAPGALDTLKELADAINDDASFAATVTAALALKINAAVLTTDGDLLTRIAGVPARLTRAGLAGDTAFSSVYETIANVALKANIASPTFTGTPAAPTAAQGTNTTQLATTAYVQTEVGLLIPKSLMTTDGDLISRSGGVPVRLTRASLAADTAFSSVYATLASPTLTGNPLAPTPSVDDNDTSIATTGFVQANSSKIWSSTSTSAPSDSVGQDGDYYIIQDPAGDKNRVMYGPKVSGTWTGVAKQLFLPETHGTLEFLRSNTSGDQSIVWQALTTGDLPPVVACTVSDSVVNVPDTTTTIIGLGATESLDTDGYHSDVTNRSRITVPTNYGGWHMVSARASWASNATGYRRINVLVSGVTRYTLYVVPAASGTAMNFAFNLLVNLSSGDYCQVEAQQTSGGNLGCTLSEFTVVRLPGS